MCAWSAGSTGAAWSASPAVATGLVGQVDFSTGAAWSAMPSVATRLVGVVDLYTGAAWSAMPSVATRLIGVVDVCCLHTLHVSVPSFRNISKKCSIDKTRKYQRLGLNFKFSYYT